MMITPIILPNTFPTLLPSLSSRVHASSSLTGRYLVTLKPQLGQDLALRGTFLLH